MLFSQIIKRIKETALDEIRKGKARGIVCQLNSRFPQPISWELESSAPERNLGMCIITSYSYILSFCHYFVEFPLSKFKGALIDLIFFSLLASIVPFPSPISLKETDVVHLAMLLPLCIQEDEDMSFIGKWYWVYVNSFASHFWTAEPKSVDERNV